MGCIPKF